MEWPPGEAQVDFGEADFYDGNGEKTMYKYLCITFPYSNAGYTQLFGGETAECVTHGLQDIFQRIGGVPSRLVFDNASGVGRRVSENAWQNYSCASRRIMALKLLSATPMRVTKMGTSRTRWAISGVISLFH
ncbi:hypothetical protein GCM10010911_53460 [Paenibacillus nasutitermitis]|uniref:Integrase core domain-containing protein n=1 Tax=Paenibacillus nasutitermitis TaxID=1652958 RepID=A0A916ZD36_9BACL|nr:hypothetical protein GCM10010911_53460 [Paenibacillus nasutitermitis]